MVNNSKPIYGPDGILYSSITKLCEKYNIKHSTFTKRIKKGYSLERALNPDHIPKSIGLQTNDHDNNTFNSVKSKCEHHNINITSYYGRLTLGWSEEQALTLVPHENRFKIICPKGITHVSKKAMLKFYNITRKQYYNRLSSGWTESQALGIDKKPFHKIRGIECHCHNNIKFSSVRKMCKYYNIPENTYKLRIKQGMSLKDALTIPPRTNNQNIWKDIDDKLCGVCLKDMMFLIKTYHYKYSEKYNYKLKDLIIYCVLFKDMNYCGINEDNNMIILKDGEEDLKQIPFKEYIESLNIGGK